MDHLENPKGLNFHVLLYMYIWDDAKTFTVSDLSIKQTLTKATEIPLVSCETRNLGCVSVLMFTDNRKPHEFVQKCQYNW